MTTAAGGFDLSSLFSLFGGGGGAQPGAGAQPASFFQQFGQTGEVPSTGFGDQLGNFFAGDNPNFYNNMNTLFELSKVIDPNQESFGNRIAQGFQPMAKGQILAKNIGLTPPGQKGPTKVETKSGNEGGTQTTITGDGEIGDIVGAVNPTDERGKNILPTILNSSQPVPSIGGGGSSPFLLGGAVEDTLQQPVQQPSGGVQQGQQVIGNPTPEANIGQYFSDIQNRGSIPVGDSTFGLNPDEIMQVFNAKLNAGNLTRQQYETAINAVNTLGRLGMDQKKLQPEIDETRARTQQLIADAKLRTTQELGAGLENSKLQTALDEVDRIINTVGIDKAPPWVHKFLYNYEKDPSGAIAGLKMQVDLRKQVRDHVKDIMTVQKGMMANLGEDAPSAMSIASSYAEQLVDKGMSVGEAGDLAVAPIRLGFGYLNNVSNLGKEEDIKHLKSAIEMFDKYPGPVQEDWIVNFLVNKGLQKDQIYKALGKKVGE